MKFGVTGGMGSRLHTFLGPYVQCFQRPISHQVKIKTCTNVDCSQRLIKESGAKFCASCGAPIQVCEVSREARVHPYDVVGDDLTELNTEEKDRLYLAPNLSKSPFKRPFFPDDETHLELMTLDASAEVGWFLKTYAKQLDKIREAYDTVEIRWGLHLYWS